ncbi:MAG: rhodanese-like domain-containing protein [Aquabacterium sp.]|nr:rhodanese-like domain-containing protein [Aquabacterium sp.]
MTRTVQSMVDEALALITTHQVDEARLMHGRDDVVFVDLRDPRELEREGVIPGAFHAPRGMLEFWVDPASPYHKAVFNQPDKHYLLFCAGGWRSALAARTMVEMGVPRVSHLHGGFTAWKAAGAPVADKPPGRHKG